MLSIIPLVSSVTFLSSILDDVSRADYIEFSRTKGLSNVELYFKHILRNLFASYLINFKHIIWITLSSLLLLERIFNMHGLSSFIFDYGSPEVLFVTFILIYVPVSLAIFMSHKVLFTITGVRGGLS
ncbi:ABC transporter permease subunit [Mammaliicoccus sciuri]|uniref:ABC transporter permease subunit n=1 Tax=Mammaliicoccus sciuri TaxID=1296 RepID=UPI0034DD1FB8